MIAAGEYADALRALGRHLEELGAARIEIVDQGSQWLVALGLEHGSDTLFLPYQLEELCADGRLRRGTKEPTGEFAFTLSQILRTLGHILDIANATSFGIYQLPEGFRLTATCPDGDTLQTLTLDEIRVLATAQQEGRRTQST